MRRRSKPLPILEIPSFIGVPRKRIANLRHLTGLHLLLHLRTELRALQLHYSTTQ
jgi:hypothetical protein